MQIQILDLAIAPQQLAAVVGPLPQYLARGPVLHDDGQIAVQLDLALDQLVVFIDGIGLNERLHRPDQPGQADAHFPLHHLGHALTLGVILVDRIQAQYPQDDGGDAPRQQPQQGRVFRPGPGHA
jgi:hypothetical protein